MTSQRPNIVTSQRRDVGSTKIEVNKRQRRDVPTSRRQHDFCLSIIKRKKGTIFEMREDRMKEGTKTRNSSDLDPEEKTDFCIFFFSDRSTDVL